MYFKTIVAAFFLDKKKSQPLTELLMLAGMTDLQKLDEESRAALGKLDASDKVIYGKWKAFADSWALIENLEFHDCLEIYSSMQHFEDTRFSATSNDDSFLEADPAFSMALTFREACDNLKPEVAFLDTQPHYGYQDWENKLGSRVWVEEQYRMISEAALEELDAEPLSLLYLDEHLSKSLPPTFSRINYDSLPVKEGRLFFAGSGSERW